MARLVNVFASLLALLSAIFRPARRRVVLGSRGGNRGFLFFFNLHLPYLQFHSSSPDAIQFPNPNHFFDLLSIADKAVCFVFDV